MWLLLGRTTTDQPIETQQEIHVTRALNPNKHWISILSSSPPLLLISLKHINPSIAAAPFLLSVVVSSLSTAATPQMDDARHRDAH